MIDISEMISDPDFLQEFTVYRQPGYWVAGDFVPNEQALTFYGIIMPATTKDLEQIPEADKVTGMMCFYVPYDTPLYVTQNYPLTGDSDPEKLNSDQCVWQGDRYRVYQTNSYDDYGYIKAICAYMPGD